MDFSGWVKQISRSSRVCTPLNYAFREESVLLKSVHDTQADCSREQHKPLGEACELLSSNFYMTGVILCLFLLKKKENVYFLLQALQIVCSKDLSIKVQ